MNSEQQKEILEELLDLKDEFEVVKAEREAVESGITTFEEEFLAHITLPNGSTVGEFTLPQVQIAYETGAMPPLLPWVNER